MSPLLFSCSYLPFLSQVDPAKLKPGFETPSHVLRNNVLSFLWLPPYCDLALVVVWNLFYPRKVKPCILFPVLSELVMYFSPSRYLYIQQTEQVQVHG
jgi:hypothetical protein